MAIKIVDATDGGAAGITLVIDMDAGNAAAFDPSDPARALVLTYGSYASSATDAEDTKAKYYARIKQEARALARERAQARNRTQIAALVGQDIT